MKRGQKTGAEQVVLKLRQIEVQTAQCKSLAIACREAEISEQSYYRGRKEYGGLQIDQARRSRSLEGLLWLQPELPSPQELALECRPEHAVAEQ